MPVEPIQSGSVHLNSVEVCQTEHLLTFAGIMAIDLIRYM